MILPSYPLSPAALCQENPSGEESIALAGRKRVECTVQGEEESQPQDPESLGICFVLALANLGFSKAGVRLGHWAFSISPGT